MREIMKSAFYITFCIKTSIYQLNNKKTALFNEMNKAVFLLFRKVDICINPDQTHE